MFWTMLRIQALKHVPEKAQLLDLLGALLHAAGSSMKGLQSSNRRSSHTSTKNRFDTLGDKDPVKRPSAAELARARHLQARVCSR